MKTIIDYSKKFIATFVLMLFAINVFSQAPPITTVGSATFLAGTYTVPITVTGFTNAADLSMTLNFDPTKLIYTGMTLNTGLVPGNAQITPTTDQSGKIKLSYTSATAIVLNAPTTDLFTLTFTVVPGVQGVQTPLTWSTLQGDCDVTPPAPGVYSPIITVANMSTYFIDGFINIPPVPEITGPMTACTGSAGNIYSTADGMSGYSWTISAGGTITSGAGTNTITVTWNTAGAQNVSVTYTDPIVGPALAPTVYNVTVGATISPVVTGPVTACIGIPGLVYFTDAGQTGYVWNIIGGTITSGATTNTVTVTWNTAGVQSITADYTPGAGCTSTPVPLNVTVNTLPVPSILGDASACEGATGIVYTTEAGMTGYTWTVSAGGTITAGNGTNAITVTWNTAGPQTVSVNYTNSNGCTAVSPVSIPVVVNALPIPGISGPLALCEGTSGVVYMTEPGMTGYTWTLSAGGTITAGAGTNAITVTWTTAGAQTVSVNYTDAVLCTAAAPTVINVTVNPVLMPTIVGPLTVGSGITTGQIYTTEVGMTGYTWSVSGAGVITAGAGTSSITVTWNNPIGAQFVYVNYTSPFGCTAASPSVLMVSFYPYPNAVNPTIIPQFTDPVPHFAAGLRVNEKAGGQLIIKVVPTQQIALSTGTILATGTIGNPATPDVGKGTYFVYSVSKDGGSTFTPPLWPSFTIEAQQGNPIDVEYRNELVGMTYANVNMLIDQTIMHGLPPTGDPTVDPYLGPIGIVPHLHGGEIPSTSDGGPMAWFTPGMALTGPAFQMGVTNLYHYPNQQEATTLWYHDHLIGGTRINVYTGLAGFYFLRGPTEENDHLPGWSGDDKVQEVTPAGKVPTFNGSNTYLPEIELAIQDRMFNVNGELYWPVAPTNPDVHPYWTPEFFGDVMTVNGKSWPYLSVAPRKYRFHLLDGCNARMLNMWLMNLNTASNGPVITVIASDGGLLDSPKTLDPASGQKLFMAPGERYEVIIDFSGLAPGTQLTLMNDAAAPYPTGDPVTIGTTDRIMQFIVNGNMVSANPPATPVDNSQVPANLRPVDPVVKLTNFDGTTNVVPDVKRQLILNEVTGSGGPLMVLINNSRMDNEPAVPGVPAQFGTITETPLEGNTETWTIINTTADAHPMHIHLTQWQLVKRQAFDAVGYMNAYTAAWAAHVPYIAPYPAMATYPGGAGSPFPYDSLNADGALGGNPAISPYLLAGTTYYANPEEQGWKDVIRVYPGEIATYIVRFCPTDRPLTATPIQKQYPFDPSIGPGYVWHCHIVDHEDNDMMRKYVVMPSLYRFPIITSQPASFAACVGDNATYTVSATSATTIAYQWQISTDGGTTWTNLADGGAYSGALSATLTINTPTFAFNNYMYRVVLTNTDGTTTSNAATLTVNACTLSGTVYYNNVAMDPLAGFTVTANSHFANTDALGAFTLNGITSGIQTITVNPNGKPVGAINSTDAGLANYWFTVPGVIPTTKFFAGDVNNDNAINAVDALDIQLYFVMNQPFTRTPWSFFNSTGTVTNNSDPNRLLPITVNVAGTSVSSVGILAQATGDFNGSFNPNAPAKSGTSNVNLALNGNIISGPNQEVNLAIRAVNPLNVGAVSLILNIPSDLVQVTGAFMNGSNVPVSYNVSGNELRIGWNSTTPVNVSAVGNLITLKLRTTENFTEGKTIGLSMVPDPLNELADRYFDVVQSPMLETDIIESSAVGINEIPDNQLSLSSFPNPFDNFTTFSYYIPSEGKVTIKIYNVLGELVNTLVDETMSQGRYTLKVDRSNLADGIYTAQIRVSASGNEMVRTIKIVVSK